MDRNYAAFCIVGAICLFGFFAFDEYLKTQVRIAQAKCPATVVSPKN